MKKALLVFGLLLSILVACDDIVEVVDISNQKVVALAPVNNAVLDTLPNTFTWEALEDAETYHLQVSTPSFESATQIVIDTVLMKTNFTKVLPVNTYEWRIRAENSGYSTVYTKESFSVEK